MIGKLISQHSQISKMSQFLLDYIAVLAESIGADFKDNYDFNRFGPIQSQLLALKENLKSILRSSGLLVASRAQQEIIKGIAYVEPHVSELEWLYDKLMDEESRKLLVNLCAYRALGHRRIKLPQNNSEHWDNIRRAKKLIVGSQSICTEFMNINLTRMNLEDIGYPIEFFYGPTGVVADFIEEQYRCVTQDGVIQCEEGDYTVDAGGCWGDTALYFACKAGSNGRVASFEFLSSNLSIFRRNLEMNPHLNERIQLFENAVWSNSESDLYVLENGPGTRVVENTQEPDARLVRTFKIDDLVATAGYPRIDFIKMDIEGAELEALKGSQDILNHSKPKLAISVYHNFRDFWEIPAYIDSLGLGYQFYLRHFSIHAEETVLFARA